MTYSAALGPGPVSPLSPADEQVLPRVSDPQFAQNPVPVIEAMGRALAEHHQADPPGQLPARTDEEVSNALDALERGEALPRPYERARPETLRSALTARPAGGPPVYTHGAPVVGYARVDGGAVVFEDSGTAGLDPPERDLAIALRSIAETFTSEVTLPFLDAYEAAGGQAPQPARLDWYALLAAFR